MDVCFKSAVELLGLLEDKKLGAQEMMQAFLKRINDTEPVIHAFATIDAEHPLHYVRRIDELRNTAHDVGRMAGMPFAVADNISTKGVYTTCASRMLENYSPVFNAAAVDNLYSAGGVLIGKLNMDEFGMGSSGENSYFQTTKNPWNVKYVAGGAAAAVAAGQVPLALGSDTGGALRLSAAFCGAVGFRPTYGVVSRYGMVEFASSLDQIGTIARTVDDAALLFSLIVGKDGKHDATSLAYLFEEIPSICARDIVVGVPKECFGKDIDAEVCKAVEEAISVLSQAGATIKEISLPSARHALAAYYAISSVEASTSMARYDGVKYGYSASGCENIDKLYEKTRTEGFGDEVKRRILLGCFLSNEPNRYYARAQAIRTRIRQEFASAYMDCDVIITPTSPMAAFEPGKRTPCEMYAVDACTVAPSLAGLPAISLPCGFDSRRMPVGMQVVGPRFSDATVLGVARRFEALVGGFPVKEVPG